MRHPQGDLRNTLVRGVVGLNIPQRPPLSFGHFPRERGNADSFAKVSQGGRSGVAIVGTVELDIVEVLAGVSDAVGVFAVG